MNRRRQRKIEKLLERYDVLDALGEGLVEEDELKELGLDEGPDHRPWCGIDAIHQRRILKAIEDYGQEGALRMELVTVEELMGMGFEVLELPPDLDDDDAMRDYSERNG